MALLLSILNKIFPGFFTSSSPKPAPVLPPEPPPRAPPPPAPYSRIVSDALVIIFAGAGLVRTSYWPPFTADVERAWGVLREPVKSYIRALIALGRTYPGPGPNERRDDWLAELKDKAANDYETMIEVIVHGVEVVATARATTGLADRARLKEPTYLDLSNQGMIERKVHVRDDQNRPLFLRGWMVADKPNEPIKLLDLHEGAKLAVATRDNSGWHCEDGWLVPGGRRRGSVRPPGDEGDLPKSNEEPPNVKPAI